MASAYLASVLITAVRDMGMLSSQDQTATTARLLGFLNREQRVWLTKVMMSVREAYRMSTATIAVVSGTTSYRIPSRAVGAKVHLIEIDDGSGGFRTLNPLASEKVRENAYMGGAGDYYFLDNSIVLASTPTANSTLRVTYPRRLNTVVDAAEAAEVASFSANAKTITLATTPPPDFAPGATSYDIVQGSPHFDTLAASESATCAGSVLTFTNALPADLAVGDYVALAGETPICQAPVELQDVLVWRTVFVYLRAMGDPKAEALKEDLKEMLDSALAILSPRAEGSPKVLINFNAPGWNRFWRNRVRR